MRLSKHMMMEVRMDRRPGTKEGSSFSKMEKQANGFSMNFQEEQSPVDI